MKKIIGISSFGLNDCISLPSVECKEAGFYLADAVLPFNPLGHIRTGKEAEEERTHSGVFWPPDARIEPDEPLRRIPISCAWKTFVEAGDRLARWHIGRGVSFPIQKIIAYHIRNIMFSALSELEPKRQSHDSYCSVIAIPDNLDEYGQELLLRDCAALGIRDAMLVWRPVAIALAWLEKVGSQITEQLNKDDHIHVIYMGPDAVEFTTFRVRVRPHNGRLYYLPLRDRPLDLPGITGVDWAANLIEMAYKKIDQGAFWQAFTNFPEIWQTISEIDWDHGKLPRPWCLGNKWSIWNPPADISKNIYNVPAGGNGTLQEIIYKSYKLSTKREEENESVGEAFDRIIKQMTRVLPNGKLLGMIICGPLAPKQLPQWFLSNLNALAMKGLKIGHELSVPHFCKVWLCGNCDNAIAEGASIYGARILNQEPTYLDKLPQLSLLIVKDGSLEWVDIVEESECEGGETYYRKIEGSFILKAKSNKLDIYLRKGFRQKTTMHDSLPDFGLSEEWCSKIQETVSRLGSVEAVLNHRGWDSHENARKFALSYAENKFKETRKSRSPYRRGDIKFPIKPDHDVPLNINVEMRPASGLAKVKVVPQDDKILDGRSIIFDYSHMEEVSEIPKLPRGWPEVVSIVCSSDTSVFSSSVFSEFLSETVGDREYTELLDGVKNLLCRNVLEWVNARSIWRKIIDQNGRAFNEEVQNVVDAISDKIGRDFNLLDTSHRSMAIKDNLIKRGTWLWARTPAPIIDFLVSYLDKTRSYSNTWLYYTEAASRCFTQVGQYEILFKAIYRRMINTHGNVVDFPIQAARSLWRVLIHRPNGQKGLNNQMAVAFINRAVSQIEGQVFERNFQKTFFQAILLFFVLLRYRKIDAQFMSPDESRYRILFKKIDDCLTNAQIMCRQYDKQRSKKVIELLRGIMDYMYYKGAPGLIHQLRKEAGDSD